MHLAFACKAQQNLDAHCLELYCWAAPGSEAHVPIGHEDIFVTGPYLHRLEMALFMGIRWGKWCCNEEQ